MHISVSPPPDAAPAKSHLPDGNSPPTPRPPTNSKKTLYYMYGPRENRRVNLWRRGGWDARLNHDLMEFVFGERSVVRGPTGLTESYHDRGIKKVVRVSNEQYKRATDETRNKFIVRYTYFCCIFQTTGRTQRKSSFVKSRFNFK